MFVFRTAPGLENSLFCQQVSFCVTTRKNEVEMTLQTVYLLPY